MKLTEAEIRLYLQRIGLDASVTADLKGLNTLIQAQLTHVPFEALDIWGAGICPSLEIADLFQKIVLDHRGGYCFELNTLFRVLLNSLGFEVYQVIASLVNDGMAAPPAHNAIICVLNGEKYFVDVGFGGPVPFGAMQLKETSQYGFRLEKRGDFWYVYRHAGAEEVCFLRFRDIAVDPCELIPLNFYISQLPDIHFRHVLRVSRRKNDGSVYALVDHELTIHSAAETQIKRISGLEELRDTLKTYFEIDMGKVKISKEY